MATKKTIKIVVGTGTELKRVLAALEKNWPDLRWIDGDRPTQDADKTGPKPSELCILELGAELKFEGDACKSTWKTQSPCEFAFAANESDWMKLAAEAYGPPKPKSAKISVKWLRNEDACADGIAWFEKTFGAKAEVDRKIVRATLKRLGHVAWLTWLDLCP